MTIKIIINKLYLFKNLAIEGLKNENKNFWIESILRNINEYKKELTDVLGGKENLSIELILINLDLFKKLAIEGLKSKDKDFWIKSILESTDKYVEDLIDELEDKKIK